MCRRPRIGAGSWCRPGPAGGTGIKYADPAGSASGVASVVAKGGAAGKGKLSVAARDKASKGQTSLPTGIAARLAGTPSARAQVLASDGACFELGATTVRKADGTVFDAVAP
jgi:hypothetical protein